jgi:hypothetical protein
MRSPSPNTLEAWRVLRSTTSDPNIAVQSQEAEVFLDCWPNPSPFDRSPPKQRPSSFTDDMMAMHSEAVEHVRASALSQDLEITVEDAAAALYFTRDLVTGDVDVQRALGVIPGGRSNPICLDSPVAPAILLGRRANANEQKRIASATASNSGHCCPVVGVTSTPLAPATSSTPAPVQNDAQHNSLTAAAVGTPVAIPVDLDAVRAELARSAAEEAQRRQTAIEAVQMLTGCEVGLAEQTLDAHLQRTTSYQHAITLAVHDLHPAARQLTFIERNLGTGVRPLSAREVTTQLAQRERLAPGITAPHTPEHVPMPPSAVHPVNLHDRFLDHAQRELHNHELAHLPYAQRMTVATNRATRGQWEEAIDAQTWQRDFHTPRANTQQPSQRLRAGGAPASHPSPCVRIAAAHEEQAQANRMHGMHAPVVVVGGGSVKLPTWTLGEESQNKGFYWSTKQFIQNAWRQYMAADGQYAPRTFKSLISPQLVPTICAETETSMAEWESISDRVLLERIEARLKPKSTTDVINRLRELTISKDASKGTLSQRYRQFAEAFLQRLAEAQECGCVIADTAVKQTFTRALKQEPALESWICEEKWTNIWDAHRRVVERLREYDAWAVYDRMQKGVQLQHVHVPPVEVPDPPKQSAGQKRAWDGSRPHQSFINALAQAFQEASANSAVQPAQQFQPAQQYQSQQQRRYEATDNYQHPGLDARGPSWHYPSATIRCNQTPCTVPFCQVCGMHGHTATQCTKRSKQMPGLNLNGYYQETKPNAAPIRYTPGNAYAPAQQPATHTSQPAVAPPPPRPSYPHFINSAASGGPIVHEERQHLVAPGGGASDPDDQYEEAEQQHQVNQSAQRGSDQPEGGPQ